MKPILILLSLTFFAPSLRARELRCEIPNNPLLSLNFTLSDASFLDPQEYVPARREIAGFISDENLTTQHLGIPDGIVRVYTNMASKAKIYPFSSRHYKPFLRAFNSVYGQGNNSNFPLICKAFTLDGITECDMKNHNTTGSFSVKLNAFEETALVTFTTSGGYANKSFDFPDLLKCAWNE